MICSAYYRNWEKHGDIIELHDRKWFRKAAWMIPDATIEHWRATVNKLGTLDIDSIAEIAALDSYQRSVNVEQDKALSRQCWQARAKRMIKSLSINSS